MKSKFQPFVIFGIIALLFSSCTSKNEKATPIDMDKLKVEIQAMEDAFAAGEKAKNVDAVAAYYSDDATSYNRNEPPSKGMGAIKEKIAKGFAKDTAGEYNVYKLVDLFAEGNMATEIGSWTKFNKAGTETENGYYMSLFQKSDGKYHCIRDMSATASPAKPGM